MKINTGLFRQQFPVGWASVLLLVSLLGFAARVRGHGYVTNPPSRSVNCHSGDNLECGPAKWDPMSFESRKNFPHAGPPDGTIAGADKYDELDEAEPGRWYFKDYAITQQDDGSYVIPVWWYLTAKHRTTKFALYLPKGEVNESKALERDDFDMENVCQDISLQGAMPIKQEYGFYCVVPQNVVEPLLNKKIVLLSVWDIADTANAFYQAIDTRLVVARDFDPEIRYKRPNAIVGVLVPSNTVPETDEVVTPAPIPDEPEAVDHRVNLCKMALPSYCVNKEEALGLVANRNDLLIQLCVDILDKACEPSHDHGSHQNNNNNNNKNNTQYEDDEKVNSNRGYPPKNLYKTKCGVTVDLNKCRRRQGMVSNPCNCESYFSCGQKRFYVQPCPRTTYFSEKQGRCEFEESVDFSKCIRRNWYDTDDYEEQ